MIKLPRVGMQSLRKLPPVEAWRAVTVRPVRTLDDLNRAFSIRTAVYMCEQACPYDEEFDGNDLNATHLIAELDGEPVATLRMRWFAGFAKLERVSILPKARHKSVVQVLIAHGFEVAARKGYTHMIAQIQSRLWPMWSNVMDCELRPGRRGFSFSDFDYVEVDIHLAEHPHKLTPNADPFEIIRPEGEWDQPGILDHSRARGIARTREAA